MNMREIAPQDILPLVVEYMREIGLKKMAKQVETKFEHQESPLHSHKLTKIIKFYIRNKQKLLNQFQEEEEEEEEFVEQQEEVQEEEEEPEQLQPGQRKHFQKFDDRKYDKLREELKDNTYEAKKRFGQGDAYGELGNEKLKLQRGDGFKKEKGKLKNRQFQGFGEINPYAVNSIKLI